ncbi:G2/mitotic-specific cyclin-B3 isoform X3 [Pieris brassicae]|uniref:G2/mitotic-specific cyclin-B3 isoform X3 n=1 Tax=Pieris brassicae TaxID=7116 RepID=UPI001E661B72|nr:G2/mitotic-specific cyclin-B3 isoform X3 [Pieris brassicae]
MAPTRLASKSVNISQNMNGIMSHGITTRSKQLATLKSYKDSLKAPNKRKADSPLKDITAKRAAFGDLTNAFNKSSGNEKCMPLKKVTVEGKMLPAVKTIKLHTAVNSKTSKGRQLQKVAANAIESVQKHFVKDLPKPIATRAQNGILKNIVRKSLDKENQNQSQSSSAKSTRSDVSEASLYTTALENKSLDEEVDVPHRVPAGVIDFDKENWNDPYQVSCYAMDIFNYLQSREPLFPIDDYLTRIKGITAWMRALLVDWMVEVQESFELNHETLYLAVKLVDLFLTRSTRKLPEREHLNKEELQLLGASALFIASKFDERIPPLVDDFLYICDGAYTLNQLIKMEIKIVKTIDFDLGIPLSYRFLRRYARCARVSMPTLTLARFILEQCLLEYSLVSLSDSKMAAAALYVALRMKNVSEWTPTLQHYTGYALSEILPIALLQNAVLHKKPKSAISTVRNKYSHSIFFEVAKLPLVDDALLTS